MKIESLHALVIDHHAGELPPEVAELLKAYLATHPAAREEAERLLGVIDITCQTMHLHPELARTFEPVNPIAPARANAAVMPVWLKAAAILTFAALTAAGGYFAGAGRTVGGMTAAGVANVTPTVRKDSPWARYRMQTDPLGRMQVVRVDAANREGRP